MNSAFVKQFEKKISFLEGAKKVLVVECESKIENWIHNLFKMNADFETILVELRKRSAAEVEFVPIYQHYLKQYFSLILFILDKLLILQNGRIIQNHQALETDKEYIVPNRFNYFNNDYAKGVERVKLSYLSVEGVIFFKQEILKEFKDHCKVSGVSFEYMQMLF